MTDPGVVIKVAPILFPGEGPYAGKWISHVPASVLCRFAAQPGVRQAHPDLWLSVAMMAIGYLAENLYDAEESTRQ